MRPPHHHRPQAMRRRGQPIVALVVLMGGWIGIRTALLGADAGPASYAGSASYARTVGSAEPAPYLANAAAGPPDQPIGASRATGRDRPGYSDRALALPPRPAPVQVRMGARTLPGAAGQGPLAPRIAGGHQLLWLAGLAALDLPPEAALALDRPRPVSALPDSGARPASPPLRWSADGWILWRRGGNGYNLPGAGLPGAATSGGAYGASQAGIVVRYRLAPASPLRPAIYVRGSSALRFPRGEELAAGFMLHPARHIPAVVSVEVRATRSADGRVAVRPAAGLVSEFPPLPLPLGLRGEAYVAAGYLGGRDGTAFVDGQARIERRIGAAGPLELRIGAGAWGGAQQGAHRLDVGPALTLAAPLGLGAGGGGGRLSADWRFRVAGDAAPGSGPALTLSAGF